MAQQSFLSDILERVGRARWIGRGTQAPSPADLTALCHDLIRDRGEVSGLVTAQRILMGYAALSDADKSAFFGSLVAEFGVDDTALQEAIAAWEPGDVNAARALHFAAEPQVQAVIRMLNLVPGATVALVAMRADLLRLMGDAPDLRGLDKDFAHLFASWFNRGFLEMRRIDWSTPAAILEKIIKYEAVHEITGWDDLRQRVGDPDRRLFAFFHPAMPDDPLIFVQVALTDALPDAIAEILQSERTQVAPDAATTAVFYSISNCQKGLRGISFGNFLIKQVVVELQRTLPGLRTFVTLSPVPRLRAWVANALANEDPLLEAVSPDARAALASEAPLRGDWARDVAALYLAHAKRPQGTAFDPVAHFHLGNGAALHRVLADADLSPRGQENSWGVMVNYLYDEDRIERNHQAYANDRKIVLSSVVRGLLRDPPS